MRVLAPSFIHVGQLPEDLSTVPLVLLRAIRDRLADALVEEWPEQEVRVESICAQDPWAAECARRMLAEMRELAIFYSEAVQALKRLCSQIAKQERTAVFYLKETAA